MLKVMRSSFKQLKWILIFIIFLFVLFVFVDWGAGRSTGGGKTGNYVAKVNGDTVTVRDYQRALYYTEKQYQQMYGQNLTPEVREMLNIPQQVVTTLIDQQLLLQQAARLHLEATPEEVRKRILEIDALNPGGKFVGQELYERYVTLNLGFPSASDFEAEVGREVTLSKLENAMENSIVISPKAAEEEYRKRSETAKIHYVLYPADRALAQVSVTPADVEAYYKTNIGKYAHGDQKRVKYLIAETARLRLQAKVDEATLRAAYEAGKDKFRMGESVRAQHILIKPAGSTPADDAAARKRADDIVAKIRAGADFAAMARENSADPGSAANGGDLGYFERGRMVPAFEQAAFSLPIGQVGDPVKSQFGYHIIKVLDKRTGGYRSFEEVRPQLEQQLREERAKDLAREQIARVHAGVDQSKPKTDQDFRRFVSDAVSYNDSGWLTKSETIPGIGKNPQLESWMQSAKPGDVGPVIETTRGPMIPWLAEQRVAGTSPLEDVRGKVENDLRSSRARQAARDTLARALAGGDIDAAATRLGVTPADATVSRGGFVQGLTGNIQAMVQAAMSAGVGQVAGPVEVDQGAVAFKVLEQNRFNPQTFEADKASLIEVMRQNEARKLRASLLEKLRKESEIVTNEAMLQTQREGA